MSPRPKVRPLDVVRMGGEGSSATEGCEISGMIGRVIRFQPSVIPTGMTGWIWRTG